MKLYSTDGDVPSSSTQLIRLVAKLAHVQDIQTVKVGPEDEALQRKSMTGRFPVLEDIANGGLTVTDSLPAARYLARDNSLFCAGSSPQQKAQIDTWIDFIQSNVVPAATRVLDQVAGKVMSDQRTFSVSLNEFRQTLVSINEHLNLRNFLVGHQMTLADALLVSTLARCFELVLDKKTRDNMLPNVARYSNLILRMAPCVKVFGTVNFCKDVTQPDFNAEKPKKEKAQKEPKQQQEQNQKKAKNEKPKQAAAATAAATAEEEKKE